MPKLGLTVMAVIAMTVTVASCGNGDRDLLTTTDPAAQTTVAPEAETGYAEINGLRMYYEIHGQGEPVILLHGAYMSAESMKPAWEVLAKTRKVIVPETQGHAHTADIDRPITYEAMADDVAAMMDTLGIAQADIVGYSMGGGTALQMGIRHPGKVKRIVSASASYLASGLYPEVLAMFPSISPEMFAGSPMEAEYKKFSPTPDKFPEFVAKLKALDNPPPDWPAKDIAGIQAPVLLVIGDQDIVKPEHAVEMFRLLGGGKPGDMGTPVPDDQLAILPGTSHIGVMMSQGELFGEMAAKFIDPPPPQPSIAPQPAPQPAGRGEQP
jgi:pimeloyl-ACP methyl ester carboxylesterase